MARKHAKEQEIDLLYYNSDTKHKTKKQTRAKKNSRPSNKGAKSKSKTAKQRQSDDSFDFDHEIVIGVNMLPKEQKDKPSKQSKASKPTTHTNTKRKTSNTKPKANKVEVKPVKRKKEKRTKEEQEKRKKRNRRIGIFAKSLVAVGILAGGITFFAMSPMFAIAEIKVIGNEKITSEEILSLSQIQIGENTYKVLNSKVEKNIKENAYIESVQMKRKLPNKVELIVKERTPNYMLALGNGFISINNQGYLLEISEAKLNLPMLTGYSTKQEEIKPGNRLNTEDLEKLDSVLKIMEAAEGNEIQHLITTIDIANKDNYRIELESKAKTVYLGDVSSINDRMLILKEILTKEEGRSGEVFLDNMNKVFFREKV